MTSESTLLNNLRDPRLTIVVGIYVALTFLVSSTHEPWADEAHAWLIARDSGLYDMLFKLPHGEGNPSLWHLILVLPAKYLSYDSLGYISLVLGLLGVVVFAYFSPFTLTTKLALPFTYFIFYQYTVISRSYSLFPVLMFAIAALYKYRFERVFLYTMILSLMATSHLFGMFVVVSLAGLHFLGLIKRWGTLSLAARRNNVICLAILFCVFCFISYQILPIQHRTLTRMVYDLSHTIWTIEASLNESFTDWYAVSLVVFVVSIVWFWQRRVLAVYLLLLAPLMTFFSVKAYFSPWHTGLLFLIWVFALWISIDSRSEARAPSLEPYTRKAMQACVYLVFGFHVYWAVAASHSDYNGRYSCGQAVAQLLKQSAVKEGKVYARHYDTVSVSPYFDKKLYYNINPGTDLSHWTWFLPDPQDDLNLVLESRPDAIVLGKEYRENDFDGYTRKNFNANSYWKERIDESNDCTVYIKNELL